MKSFYENFREIGFPKKRIKFIDFWLLSFIYFQTKQKEYSKRGDLGAIFNDGTLNLQYVDPDSGEINPIFTHKEENNRISIRCEICGLTVVGKVSLDTHRTGKKHKANLEKYEMSGKNLQIIHSNPSSPNMIFVARKNHAMENHVRWEIADVLVV